MPDITIGNIKVGVIPDFTGFAEKLRAGLGPAMQQAMANMQTANQRINGNASGSTSAASHIANAQASSGFGLGNRFAGGMGYAPPGFAGMNGSGSQVASALLQAASGLTQAAQQLNTAIGNLSRLPAGGGGGNPANPSTRGGRSTRGLSGFSRYIAAGFLAREGLNAIQAGRGYAIDSAMAGNDSAAQYGAEMNLYNRVSGIPIFGQAADFLADPSGARHLGAQGMMDSADTQDQLGAMNYGLRTQTMNMRTEAALARYGGAMRKAEEAQVAFEQTMQKIASEQKGPEAQSRLDKLAKLKADEIAGVESKYYEMIANRGNPEAAMTPGIGNFGSDTTAADQWRQGQLAAVEANDVRRRKSQDEQFDFQRRSAKDKLNADLEAMRFEYKLDAFRSLGEIEGAHYRMQGMPRQAIISGAQYEKDALIKQENAGRGPYDLRTEDGREAYQHAQDLIDARRDEQLHNFDADYNRQRFMLRTQNESLSILTARDGGTPAMRSMAANANDLVRHTQLDAMEAFQSGHPDLVQGIYRRGQGQARLAQQDFLNGLVASEVDPRRTALSGPGTEDPSKTFDSIDKAINEMLNRIPSDLPDLLRQMGLNGSGARAS